MRTLLAATLFIAAGPALADHANPWATDNDTVLSQFHEENQAQSEDTPGEDEMKGRMVRSARGKLDDSVGSQGGTSSGRSGGRR